MRLYDTRDCLTTGSLGGPRDGTRSRVVTMWHGRGNRRVTE